jgi:hypothetical protein
VADDDLVDRDEDQLHEEADEADCEEADRREARDLGKLLGIGLLAALEEPAVKAAAGGEAGAAWATATRRATAQRDLELPARSRRHLD